MNESSSGARVAFARKVKNGEYTLAQAEEELDRMEARYGEEAFLSGSVIRKEPPWTMEDLESLDREVTAGAGSREFLHYMAEVSDAVYSKKRRTKMLAIVGGVVAALALIGAAVAFVRHQQSEINRLQAALATVQQQQAEIAAMLQQEQTNV